MDKHLENKMNRQASDKIDQVQTTLQIIIEQSIEFQAILYINLIDFEKAFDSVDREALWKLLWHYGMPHKIADIIKTTHHNMRHGIIHGGSLTKFEDHHHLWRQANRHLRLILWQGCLFPPILFLIITVWIIKNTTETGGTEIDTLNSWNYPV